MDLSSKTRLRVYGILLLLFFTQAAAGLPRQTGNRAFAAGPSPRPEASMLQGALAQNQLRIRGKVTDQSGAPLPGVTVTIEGTTRGVITDTDGTYSIDCKAGEKLVFSFVGMETQIIALTNQTVIDVKLLEKTEELEDVTVMAFGRAKKESVVSSISTVKPAFPKRLTRLA